MSCAPPTWFDHVFAIPRMSPYLSAATTQGTHAEDLYRWNLQASESFYPALSCLEISVRNAIHRHLRRQYARLDWWAVVPLNRHDSSRVRQVSDDLRDRKKVNPPKPDDIVAELPFGFWVSMVSRRYDRHLWVPALHKAFPHYRGRREPLHDSLDAMRRLRNRIMHHEPIHHRHLAADHAKMYRLIGYIEPATVGWLRAFDRVPHVLAMRP